MRSNEIAKYLITQILFLSNSGTIYRSILNLVRDSNGEIAEKSGWVKIG